MERWTEEQANRWWAQQPWAIGFNYVPSNAVNDVEMWMDATFDLPLIRKELAIAKNLGFNSIRVFLSALVWKQEGAVFEKNFDRFLEAAEKNGLSVMPILFDDCAFDFGADPVYGKQPDPVPGVHNGRWVPSPGFRVQDDPVALEECRGFVDAIVGGHREDDRILLWDLFNEPGNTKRGSKSIPLLQKAFAWARAWEPIQPLSAGMWNFSASMDEVNAVCAALSDVITVHAYTPLQETKKRLEMAKAFGRPVLVTEWFHRPAGNGYSDHLPLFCKEKIGIWQWGMIVGKTQTNLSWATKDGGAPDEKPPVWQHDLLLQDGTPYDPEELRLLKQYSTQP